MRTEQGEIIEVNVYLPGGGFKPHPAVVISNNSVHRYENAAIVAMITSLDIDDEFSFRISDEMLSVKPKKPCQVRCHLINLVTEKDIISRHGRMKVKFLKELIAQISSVVFSIE